jgi:hypothetical protein
MFGLSHRALHAVVSFDDSIGLQPNLLDHLFSYPTSSRFRATPGPMAVTCGRLNMSSELVSLIRCAEWLILDTEVWLANPASYQWDAMDLQTLYSISIEGFMRWYIDNVANASSEATAASGIVCLCMFMFLAFVCRGRQAIYGPLPGVVGKLRGHFTNVNLLDPLASSGLDVWIAVLVVLGSYGLPDESFFMEIFNRVMEVQEEKIEAFDALKIALWKCCVWTPVLDTYAARVWSRFTGHASGRSRQPFELPNQLPLNPYTPGHPASHMSIMGLSMVAEHP